MITFHQPHRAGLEFVGSLQRFSSSVLRNEAAEDLAAMAGPDIVETPIGDRDPDAALAEVHALIEHSPAARFERFYQRFVAEQVYDRSIPATEEQRPAAEAMLAAPVDTSQAGRLILDPDMPVPDYFDGVEWHLQPGGWDGYDLSIPMFMAGVVPYVFKHGGYAAVVVDANTREHRRLVLEQLPRRDYQRIYEAGSGGVPTLATARQLFPHAELIGGDLSASMQKAGHRMAAMMNLNVTLRQEDSRHTAEADASVDAVVIYATLHEMPDDVVRETFAEMFRILKPGGDIVISDPPPLKAVSPYLGYLLDWDNDFREEPFFGQHVRRDLTAMLAEAGFTHTDEKALGEAAYPWMTIAHKPDAAQ